MLEWLLPSKERKKDNNVGKDIKKSESLYTVVSVQFNHSIVPDSFWCQTAACQASLSITNPGDYSNSLPSSRWCHPTNLILCCPLLLLLSILPSIRVFSNELPLHIRWPKYWSFKFSISPSNEYSELTSFRIDWFDLLVVQGTLKSLLQQFKSFNSSVFSFLYSPTLTSIYDCWTNHSFN